MKSIYVDDKIHSALKLLASLEGKALSEAVEECLQFSLKKRLSDLPPEILEKLAASGGSFDFLLDEKEDLYNDEDGELLNS